MTGGLILIRALHLAATVFAAGSVGFVLLVADPAAAAAAPAGYRAWRRRMVQAIWAALALAVLSGAAWLALLSAEIYQAPIIEVCLHGGIWTVLSDTRFGLVSSARLVLALALGLLLLWTGARLLQLAVAAALLALIALSGHAGATPGSAGAIHLVSDMVHLLAAGLWLGGLPALTLLLARTRRQSGQPAWNDLAVAATRRFSRLGIGSVVLLTATGLVNSWNLVGGPADLVSTDYGRMLTLKIGLFLAMLGIAAVNRFQLTPRLPGAGALRALARNGLAEGVLGLGVLLFVGALGTLSPSNHAHHVEATVPADAAFVHIHTNEAMAEVTVEPGQAGVVNARIRLLREDFSELPADSVELAFELSAARKVVRSAAHLPDGNWQVNGLELTPGGTWTVRVIINVGNKTPIVLDAPIVIER